MRVVDIIPKEIHVQIELSLVTIQQLVIALDLASINVPDDKMECFTTLNEFNAMLLALVKDMDNGIK